MVAEKVFAVIAESTRRDILKALAHESKAVGTLVEELGVSQPTVSKHLRVMREAGVVTMRAQGQKRFYGINTEPLVLISAWLQSVGAGTEATPRTLHGAASQPAPSQGVVADETHEGAAAPDTTARPAESKELPVDPWLADPVPVDALPLDALPLDALPLAAVARSATEPTVTATISLDAASSEAVVPNNSATAPAFVKAEPAPADPAVAVVPVVASAAASSQVMLVPSHDHESGVQGQISRSVGRAAHRAADLLANLPALPTFRRRRD